MKDLAILIPTWKGADLLNTCLHSIFKNCVTSYDVIVLINDLDGDTLSVCQKFGVKYVASNTNFGTLAVDLAVPFLERDGYKYVANLNNDMIVCPEWDKKLIEYYEANDCVSVSSPAVEYNGGANQLDTLNDPDLPPFTNLSIIYKFNENYLNGKYKFPNVISQRHPILMSYEHFKAVGYYSKWDFSWVVGYTLDFYQPYLLWKLTGSNKMISVGDAPVFHDYSATMKKLSPNLQSQNCWEVFRSKTGMSVDEFKKQIDFNKMV